MQTVYRYGHAVTYKLETVAARKPPRPSLQNARVSNNNLDTCCTLVECPTLKLFSVLYIRTGELSNSTAMTRTQCIHTVFSEQIPFIYGSRWCCWMHTAGDDFTDNYSLSRLFTRLPTHSTPPKKQTKKFSSELIRNLNCYRYDANENHDNHPFCDCPCFWNNNSDVYLQMFISYPVNDTLHTISRHQMHLISLFTSFKP